MRQALELLDLLSKLERHAPPDLLDAHAGDMAIIRAMIVGACQLRENEMWLEALGRRWPSRAQKAQWN